MANSESENKRIAKNTIVITEISVLKYRIQYKYIIGGEWQKYFKNEEPFFIEYSTDISDVPKSIAIVPLLANILPIAWICNAEIIAPVCDKSFYESIEKFKKGYCGMYPMMDFKGTLSIDIIEENRNVKDGGSAAFFSGGVDAFNTLVNHSTEFPTLITLWGADVKMDDENGWSNVEKHLKSTCNDFNVESVAVKTSFRMFILEGELTALVAKSGDGWWHGFQHGIGIISHAAPIAYVLGKKTIYFASSFTAADKGKVTCASDPTIDNFVKFADTQIVHDGYEFNRQMKIHNIVNFSKLNSQKIALRVCWISTGGSNCCKCEKCWRTMLGLYAEGTDPKEFGFEYSDEEFRSVAKTMSRSSNEMLSALRYGPIQDALHKNREIKDVLPELKWFYKTHRANLGKHPYLDFCRKIQNKLSFILRKLRIQLK